MSYQPNAPTGNSTYVKVLSGASDSNPSRFDLLDWSTPNGAPAELELLVYPLFQGDPRIDPDQQSLPTFLTCAVNIQWSPGAGDAAGSVRHQSNALIPDGPPAFASYHDRMFEQIALPDHGLKLRIAARSLRVKLVVRANPVNFIAMASVQPVIGGRASDVVAPVTSIEAIPKMIPYGAREFRIAKWPLSRALNGTDFAPDPNLVIEMYQSNFPSIALPASLQTFIASDVTEWTALPGEVVSFAPQIEAFGTILFR